MPTRTKVFGIGFHKTGTKSLHRALESLGYRTASAFGVHDPDIARNALVRAVEIAKDFDAFEDNPWPVLYRELDRAFPGSKFILTVSPTADWIERVVRHLGPHETPMRTWIYGAGSPVGNEALYAARYDEHNEEVEAYFADRPGDLLVFRLTEAPDWRPLCSFLGLPPPEGVAFPHANAGRVAPARLDAGAPS